MTKERTKQASLQRECLPSCHNYRIFCALPRTGLHTIIKLTFTVDMEHMEIITAVHLRGSTDETYRTQNR